MAPPPTPVRAALLCGFARAARDLALADAAAVDGSQHLVEHALAGRLLAARIARLGLRVCAQLLGQLGGGSIGVAGHGIGLRGFGPQEVPEPLENARGQRGGHLLASAVGRRLPRGGAACRCLQGLQQLRSANGIRAATACWICSASAVAAQCCGQLLDLRPGGLCGDLTRPTHRPARRAAVAFTVRRPRRSSCRRGRRDRKPGSAAGKSTPGTSQRRGKRQQYERQRRDQAARNGQRKELGAHPARAPCATRARGAGSTSGPSPLAARTTRRCAARPRKPGARVGRRGGLRPAFGAATGASTQTRRRADRGKTGRTEARAASTSGAGIGRASQSCSASSASSAQTSVSASPQPDTVAYPCRGAVQPAQKGIALRHARGSRSRRIGGACGGAGLQQTRRTRYDRGILVDR